MVKETNKAVAGEASSSRRLRKRQRLPSVAENEGRETASVDDGDEVILEARSGTLLDLDLLDCPVCYQALTQHVYQCDNGHIACSSCCHKLRNKCPACSLPIGNNRCRIMERIVESVNVPCPNAKYGCTEKFSYGNELAHEKECHFALCYCPKPNCNYAGVYKDLYSHFDANHNYTWNSFVCGSLRNPRLSTGSNISVLQECRGGPLVVVQCFEVPQGMSVTVNCVAPSAPGVGRFSYNLTYSMGRHTVTFESTEMNRIQKVSLETPQDDFMSIPSYLVSPINFYKRLGVCIRRLEEAAEEEEEEEEDGEEEEVEEEDGEEEEAVEVDVVNNVRRSTREKKSNSKYQNKVK